MSQMMQFDRAVNLQDLGDTSFERSLLDIASEKGQNEWLGPNGANQLRTRLPYPFRGHKMSDGRDGHPLVLPFSLMLRIRDEYSGAGAPVSRDEFINTLRAAFSTEENQFDYINDLSEEEFINWKNLINEKGIAGNEAWGQNAIALLRGLNLGRLVDGKFNLDSNDIRILEELRKSFISFSTLDGMETLVTFTYKIDLLKALIIAHHNWRKSVRLQDVELGEDYYRSIFDMSEADLVTSEVRGKAIESSDLDRAVELYGSLNRDIRNRNISPDILLTTKSTIEMIRNTKIDSMRSFLSMVNIAYEVNTTLRGAYTDSEEDTQIRTLLLPVWNWLIEEIKKDANTAPIEAIFSAINHKDYLEG